MSFRVGMNDKTGYWQLDLAKGFVAHCKNCLTEIDFDNVEFYFCKDTKKFYCVNCKLKGWTFCLLKDYHEHYLIKRVNFVE